MSKHKIIFDMMGTKCHAFVGNMLIMKTSDDEGKFEGIQKYLVTLVGFSDEDLIKGEGLDRSVEMIEGEVIIIPKRIRRKNIGEQGFNAMRIDQMLTSDWGKPERWEETEEI